MMWRIKSVLQAAHRSTAHVAPWKTRSSLSLASRQLYSHKAAVTAVEHHESHFGKAAALAGFGVIALALNQSDSTRLEEAPVEEITKPKVVPGEVKDNLLTYTLEDVANHVNTKVGIWVVYKNGVYDVSKFVAKHPGGTKLLLAAGKSIEPFWQIYAAHNHTDVHEILEELRIGNLDPKDVKFLEEERIKRYGNGPYANDPERNPLFKINSSQPFNAEPPSELLLESFITPNDLFFVRNHLPVPNIDPSTFKLEISGLGVRSGDTEKPNVVTFTLDELKKTFKEHTVVTTIQCAGNRRAEMSAIKPVKGLSWDTTAVSTATWTGVLLSDVLKHIGVSDEQHCRPFPTACPTCDNLPLDRDCPSCETTIEHCHLEGLDRDATGQCYGASIPISTALDPRKDVLLAYSMNGVRHLHPMQVCSNFCLSRSRFHEIMAFHCVRSFQGLSARAMSSFSAGLSSRMKSTKASGSRRTTEASPQRSTTRRPTLASSQDRPSKSCPSSRPSQSQSQDKHGRHKAQTSTTS
ncbi:hypothetical protein AC1031_015436 [Aphanomyces cochlioides]|nr:hypothetical protein AC1031_015436 [Aphanomyces cochlioides]